LQDLSSRNHTGSFKDSSTLLYFTVCIGGRTTCFEVQYISLRSVGKKATQTRAAEMKTILLHPSRAMLPGTTVVYYSH